MRVEYSVSGEKAVEHRLLGMAARAVESRPILEAFGDVLENKMTTVFAAEGPGWEPLSPVTVARKGHSTIGRQTDAMMDSLTKEAAEGAMREIIGDELHFGTNLTSEDGTYYPGIFHAGRDGQPARPFPGVTSRDLRAFSKGLQAYLVGIERATFGVGSFGMSSLDPFGV